MMRLKLWTIPLLLLFLAPAISTPVYASLFPEVVDTLEIESFMGRWYEIASTQPSEQKDCICTTADYASIDDKTFGITNSCRKKTIDGMLDIREGKAKLTRNPGKIKVTFDGDHFPFFSNYWIVDLAADYRYVVITTGLKKPIWILARSQSLNQEDMGGILNRLHRDYYNLTKLRLTHQIGCQHSEI